MEEKRADRIIEERKERLKEIFINKNLWVIGVLIILVILGAYIRSLPMSDHGGLPGLWDVTTNTWTLGPDLDPFLFLRYAKEMVHGSLPAVDTMRNVPLGFPTSSELQMVSYMIVLTYNVVNIFGSYDINFAANIMPVIFFALTSLSFFLFVREIFIRKDEPQLKANVIAIISTSFMVTIPVFLSRTIAGIPEKESVGFFFMFLALYFFLKAWKSEKIKFAAVFGVLAGILTGLMGLTWGGVSYLYVTISLAVFAAFVLNKIGKKETMIYTSWLLVSLIVTLMFTTRFSIRGFITSLDSGLSILVLVIILVHFVLWQTRLSNIKFLNNLKIPKNIISLILSIIIGLILVSILFGPSFIFEKISAFYQMMFNPVTGRWNTTVAENRQPFFTEWANNFGPIIRGIPVMFWLFFIGSVVLFRNMLSDIKRKDAWILTALYILFFMGLVFSRYAPHPAVLDGEGFLSKLMYLGFAGLFVIGLFYYFIKYHREGNKGFEKIKFEIILLFSLLVLCLFTARSAVRLIMVLGPIAPIFATYLTVQSTGKLKKSEDETKKIVYGVVALILISLMCFTLWSYYQTIKNEAYSYVPSGYSQQWQKAMSWVRNETPKSAVFAHWWDYGYWVQSIGERATVTDGGNVITWWNYLTGRYVLTGDNQQDALNFLYSHNATHLLIDSTDMGKYGAFSSIGSNKDFDRASNGPVTMLADLKSIRETKETYILGYNIPIGNGQIAISSLEEDISIDINNSQVNLIREKTGLIGIEIEIIKMNNSITFESADAIFYTANGERVNLPLRYIYYNNTFVDFEEGIPAAVYVIPKVSQTSIDPLGAAMYISPRLMRGMLSQVYLLNDPFKKFQNLKLVHSEPDLNIDSINKQGYSVNEFTYFEGRGVQGPIKIWEIEYTGKEQIDPDYIRTTPPSYIDWKF